jgi:cobaltochelatase CobS
MFATSNTVGLGNPHGMYQGTQLLNHAQLDRWSVVATLDYLERQQEIDIVVASACRSSPQSLVANLSNPWSRVGRADPEGICFGDIAVLMSPRTVITWAENCEIFRDPLDGLPLELSQ